MADEKKKEDKGTKFSGENLLPDAIDKFESQLRNDMGNRPYLVVVATGYEMGKDGGKTVLAAQWSWRSNVIVGGEDSDKLVDFLAGQLKDAVEHPENGVKKKYAKKK